MTTMVYKNMEVEERRFRVDKGYYVIGDAYLEDVIIQGKMRISHFLILRSAEQFIEQENAKTKLILKAEKNNREK